ncbi:DUF4381 domain-containing protein [Vibrio algivorus]|uniref:DUF4381 domain-containing protein n=1 Tax=Vibrio algivorus TaxID=1667024 RepID=A0A557P0E6_9VIBR|nr:DUF4381 domain-containing protein [Vibrio algivorus]TVO34104.1 DUF4381 domain-containing protein [Vibrio algivorus]
MTQPAPPGSYILRDLNEVGLPDHVSWFPQTLGWKIVGVVALIILAYCLYKYTRRWWQNRYRLEAIKVTESLSLDDPKFEYKLFVIIKRVLGHLNEKHQALYGDDFIKVVNEFPVKQPLTLEPILGQSWVSSLTSQKACLVNSDKEKLKLFCLNWLEFHQNKEIQ